MRTERKLEVGPDARDFGAAFGVSADSGAIDPVDGVGVALAAIQRLHELVEQHARELAELAARLDDPRTG